MTVITKKRNADGTVSVSKEHVYNKTLREAAREISLNREVSSMSIKRASRDELQLNDYLDNSINLSKAGKSHEHSIKMLKENPHLANTTTVSRPHSHLEQRRNQLNASITTSKTGVGEQASRSRKNQIQMVLRQKRGSQPSEMGVKMQ